MSTQRAHPRAADLPREGRSRAVILAVRPSVDGGRWPIKRVLGEPVIVEADIVADGHDLLAGALLHRHETDAEWREVPLAPAGNDVFRATFTPDKLGRHRYTIVAWVDALATADHDIERKRAAGQDVSVELLGRERLARAPSRAFATRGPAELEVVVERPVARTGAWYEMFPRSCGPAGRHGTFRDAESRLPYIAEMGFDVLYLPPIHPIGLAFRKGPNNSPAAGPFDPGSPWAIGSPAGGHTSVHPDLGTLEDFRRFTSKAASLGLEVALDIAFQASPDHPWVREHPEWFKKRADGTIQYAENPPKKYQDVYPFDFESEAWESLWEALRGVILFWAERGVRVFRVDNPHTKPIPFWEWCIRTVKEIYPDAVFLSEAFTRPKLKYALAKAGFSQSYTYFTWRTTKVEITRYLKELTRADVAEYFRPALWPTTPDIFPEHLQHGGRPAFIVRLVLAATLSATYGIYGPSYELLEREPRPGAEELRDNEKYQLRDWDIDRPDSLRHVIARVNRIRRDNPALAENTRLHFHETDNDLVLCYSKRTPDGSSVILVVVNLDPHHGHSAWLHLDLAELGVAEDAPFQAHDLLGGDQYFWRGPRAYVELSPAVMPAHVLLLRRLVRNENMFEYFL